MFNDAGCPWGYSANPAFRVLEWRYGDQLDWRLVLIGLTDVAQEYVDRGYTPIRSAEGYARRFRRFGMPLAPEPAGADPRHRSLLPRDRRGATPVAGPGVGRVPRAAARLLHHDAAARRGRVDRAGAARRRRDRRGGRDRGDRHARGGGGLPARPRRGPQRARLADPAPGQARDERRPGSLHGAVTGVRARRPTARGGRLADGRGLRRDRREPASPTARGVRVPDDAGSCSRSSRKGSPRRRWRSS